MNLESNPIDVLNNFFKKNKSNMIYVFCIFTVGFLTHGYMFANKLSNHDDINFMFDIGATYNLGRWFLPAVGLISGNISMPWFIGIISIFIIAVSAAFVIKILEIDSNIIRFMIGVLMVVFPVTASTFLYIYTAIAYAAALLLATLAVYWCMKEKIAYTVLSIVCCILSIALYQSYFCFSVGLFLLVVIKKCMDNTESHKKIFLSGIRYLGVLGIGCCLYYFINKLILSYLNIEMAPHKGLDQMGHFENIKNQIRMTYTSVVRLFTTEYYAISASSVARASSFLMLACGIVLSIYFLWYMTCSKNYRKGHITLYIIANLLYPMGVNSIFILCPVVESVYTIMLYSNVLFFIYTLFMLERIYKIRHFSLNHLLKKISVLCQWGIMIALCFLVYSYELTINATYLKVHLIQKETESILNQLVTQIKELDGYTEDLPVAVIGKTQNETLYSESCINFVDKMGGLDSAYVLMGMDGVRYGIMKYYCGFSPEYIYDYDAIKQTAEFKQMPEYPNDGSIRIIDDTIVVKFQGE